MPTGVQTLVEAEFPRWGPTYPADKAAPHARSSSRLLSEGTSPEAVQVRQVGSSSPGNLQFREI